MEARKVDEFSTVDNFLEKILALSAMDYLQAQTFLAKYWETEFYQRLAAQFNHQPGQMSADDYILFLLSRREGQPDYAKLTTSLEQTKLNFNEETKNHLTILQMVAKINTAIDKKERRVLNLEIGHALARRNLKVDPRYERVSSEEAKQKEKPWFETLSEEEKRQYDEDFKKIREDSKKRRRADKEKRRHQYGETRYAEFKKQEQESKKRRKLWEEKEQLLPNPTKNPELFPIHQLLEQERKCVRRKNGSIESYLDDFKPTFLNLSSLVFKNLNFRISDLIVLDPFLYGVYLRKADFSAAKHVPDIFNSNLQEANMSEARVSELRGCYLHLVKFNKARLSLARIKDCPYLAPTDFVSLEAFSNAIEKLRKNLAGNESFFIKPFELEVVTDIINFIKRIFQDKYVQVQFLAKMQDHYMPLEPTAAFSAEWKKTGSLFSAVPSFFGAYLPRSQLDPAVPCLALIKEEIIRIAKPLLTEIETQEQQNRSARGM